MNEFTIWFDMDGTIADLYGVENWLDYLLSHNPYPYMVAKPLVRLQSLARILNRLQREGWKIGIVSWLSRDNDPDYGELVTQAKMMWLRTHLKSVQWDYVDIIPNGTPKHEGRRGILFDDEEQNRSAWTGLAYDVENIIETLKGLGR